MYLARFTRPDILQAVSYLATKSSNPTVEHMTKLHRVLRYLAGTPDIGIIYESSGNMNPSILADASHCCHDDGHGHGGIAIMIGKNNEIMYTADLGN
jgi:hypothetical protein